MPFFDFRHYVSLLLLCQKTYAWMYSLPVALVSPIEVLSTYAGGYSSHCSCSAKGRELFV